MGNHSRPPSLRRLDGGALSSLILPRHVRLGQRQPVHRVQLRPQWLRHGVPGARDHLRMHDVVRAVPGVGNGGDAPKFLPYAAGLQEILHAMDVRRVAE